MSRFTRDIYSKSLGKTESETSRITCGKSGRGALARADVRARVLEAAESVFAKKGYRRTTVADILDEAGIARATFYKYFRNKRQVFMELMRDFLKTLYENSSNYLLDGQVATGAIASRIRETLMLFYKLFIENRELMEIYFREAFGHDPGLYAVWDEFERRFVALLRKVLDRGMDEGVFRRMDTALVARALSMVFLQVPYRNLVDEGRVDLDIESIAEEMVRLAMDGITMRG